MQPVRRTCMRSLSLFKNVLPERKTYSQESLVTDLLGVSYGAHDSLEDVHVRALQKLVSHANVNSKEISESSFTVDYALESTKYCVNKHAYPATPNCSQGRKQGNGRENCRFKLAVMPHQSCISKGWPRGHCQYFIRDDKWKGKGNKIKKDSSTAVQIFQRSSVNTLQVNVFHFVCCYHYLHFFKNNCTLSTTICFLQ